jgi:hypothetical protein
MDDRPFSNVVAGAILPLLQSLITAFLVGLAAGNLAALASLPAAGRVGLAAGALAAALYWLASLVTWRRVELLACEPWNPAPAPEPEPVWEPAPPVRIEVLEGRATHLIDLPASEDQLIDLATGLLSGQSLSEAAWTGGGRPFTRAEFANLRAELMRRGLAAWNNPKTPARGAALTAPGRAVMRHYAAMAEGVGELAEG